MKVNNINLATPKSLTFTHYKAKENVPSERITNSSGRLNECYRNYFFAQYSSNKPKQDFTRFIYKDGRVELSEIESLSKEEKRNLVKYSKDYLKSHYYARFKVSPEVFAKSAIELKSYFDEKYGPDNYRIISLGTSPSVCTQGMEFLGCDVVHLPVSGMHETDEEVMAYKDFDYYEQYRNTKIIMKYLKSSGFKKDDKINIVLDYSSSKHTLDVMTEGIMRCFKLGIDDIDSLDLIDVLLDAIAQNPKTDLTPEEINKMSQMMGFEEMEQITPIPHFYVDNANNLMTRHSISSLFKKDEDVISEINRFSTPISRAFSVCVYSELEKLNKKNPMARP